MFRSKYTKIIALIIGIILLSVIFYVFNNKSNKEIASNNVNNEQISNDYVTQEMSAKEEYNKEKVSNLVQKYYETNLEQDEIKFFMNAKTSKDNDLEFSKLQMKFTKAMDILNDKYIENIDPNDAYYKNNWVKIPFVEGSYFYAVNSEYFLKKYGKYLSPAYNEWLKFIVKRESVMQDGGLKVPPDKLREYIISLENFVAQYPDFVLVGDAKDILESYLMTYLEGIDNSPIFDKWNTRKMLPEFKTSYEKFLSENKDSKYYPMVEEFYSKAKANDFNWDKNFDQWLYEYHKKYFAD